MTNSTISQMKANNRKINLVMYSLLNLTYTLQNVDGPIPQVSDVTAVVAGSRYVVRKVYWFDLSPRQVE